MQIISRSSKVYVIYYTKIKGYKLGSFYYQAHDFYNYYSNLPMTSYKEVSTTNDFINAWNNMPKNTENVFIFVHGGVGKLYFKNGEISSLSKLKNKPVRSKVWLFSCKGAYGGKNSIAAKLAKKCIGSYVYALTCSLSYSFSNQAFWGKKHGYYACPARNYLGLWMYFNYYYYRGKLTYKSDCLYY